MREFETPPSPALRPPSFSGRGERSRSLALLPLLPLPLRQRMVEKVLAAHAIAVSQMGCNFWFAEDDAGTNAQLQCWRD
jgi:hypothetical protein